MLKTKKINKLKKLTLGEILWNLRFVNLMSLQLWRCMK